MARAKYQILVIPYYIENGQIQYCLFHRSDMNVWQFIAGGGEDEDDSILISAKREAYEEATICLSNDYMKLDTVCSIPTNCFKNAKELWGKDCYVIPEYCFAVRLYKKELSISSEHTECEWSDYQTAISKLKYDSNKTALWELHCRLKENFLD